MRFRRAVRLALVACSVSLVLCGAPALADVLYGFVTQVDVAAKKVVVSQEETQRPVELTITDKTKFVTKKGAVKADLEKLSRVLKKAQDEGRIGLPVRVDHAKGAAQKITLTPTKN